MVLSGFLGGALLGLLVSDTTQILRKCVGVLVSITTLLLGFIVLSFMYELWTLAVGGEWVPGIGMWKTILINFVLNPKEFLLFCSSTLSFFAVHLIQNKSVRSDEHTV